MNSSYKMFQVCCDHTKVRVSAIFVNIRQVIDANNKNIPHEMPHVRQTRESY